MTQDNLRTDEFGYGAHLIASFEAYCTVQRGSGRTTRLLDSLKPGDIIVTLRSITTRFYEREIERRGLKDVGVLSLGDRPADLEQRMYNARCQATRPVRFRYDEDLVEALLRKKVMAAATELDGLQRRVSNTAEEFEQYAHDRAVQARYAPSYSRAFDRV